MKAFLASLVFLLANLWSSAVTAQTRAPETKQFDFWIGEWQMHSKQRVAPGKDEWLEGAAANSIKASFKGQVIEEQFDGSTLKQPFKGMSVSVYNPTLGKWKQTWVDDQGSYLDFVGEFKDDKMVLSRSFEQNGKSIHQRMVFKDIAKDSLTWHWERSMDGGKTWVLMWELKYTRKAN